MIFDFLKNKEGALPASDSDKLAAVTAQLRALQSASSEIATTRDLRSIIHQLTDTLNYTYAGIWTINEATQMYDAVATNMPKYALDTFTGISANSEVKNIFNKALSTQQLQVSKKLTDLVISGLGKVKSEQLQAELVAGAYVVCPISSPTENIGCLVVFKETSAVENSDLELLKTFADLTSSAIQYSRAEVIRNSNSIEVGQRSKELNLFYELSSNISQSLDPEVVAQSATDALGKDDTLVLTIVSHLDVANQLLIPVAITRSGLTDAIKKMIGSLEQYAMPITGAESHDILSLAVKTGQPQYSESLMSLASPPLPKAVVLTIEKLISFKCAIVFPLKVREEVIGCISYAFSKKLLSDAEINAICPETVGVDIKSYPKPINLGSSTTNESIRLYSSFSSQVGVSLENAKLFQSLNEKQERLKGLVDLSNSVTATLDPIVVAQSAVDVLPKNKDIIGAFISFYEKETGITKMMAVTQNAVLEAVEKLLGKKLTEYVGNVKDPLFKDNIITQAILRAESLCTDEMDRLFSPYIPAQFAGPLAKIINAGSTVTHPLIVRQEVLGTITFLMRHQTQEQFDTMKLEIAEYASQISIALENAKLFSKLQSALDQVKEGQRRERDMLDVMGHELRTPISIVRNGLLMLDRDYVQNDGVIEKDKLRKYLDMTIESVRREINLIETLLSATKVDASRMQLMTTKVDLNDVVNDGIEGQKAMMGTKGLQLIYQPAANEQFVFADRTRTQEVMDNFLSNAVKYTKSGAITINAWLTKDYGCVSIADTGEGISVEDLQNLGKKFFRAKQYVSGTDSDDTTVLRPGGTGLGLYVTFDLLRIMQGKLYIDSKVGKGSTFTFLLPLYKGQADSQLDETFATNDDARSHIVINGKSPKPPKA